jgi:hypothetical protein
LKKLPKAKSERLVVLAKRILEGSTIALEDIREINSLRFEIDGPTNQMFFAIIALESETDIFPVGAARKFYDPGVLKQLDIQLHEYIQAHSASVKLACGMIIKAFVSPKQSRST